jgi:hypothetical protein
MTTHSPAEDFGTVLDRRTGGDHGTAAVAAEAYAPGASAEIKKTGADQLNQSLQSSGLIPGVDIVGILEDSNPNDSLIQVEIAPENSNGAGKTSATYDAESHVLQYDRPAHLPGNQGNEHVLINMVTGQENVISDPRQDGSRTVSTRANAGDMAYTNSTVNTANQVTATEGVDKDGHPLPKREYRYGQDGKLSGVIEGGKPLDVPAGATVNIDPRKGPVGEISYPKQVPGVQEGPVQVKLNPDGTSSMTMPGENGRTYNVGRDNKISYTPKEGDNLWNISKDIARLQGNANPTDQDIQNMVAKIGHAGVGGDANKINTGEPITFGAAPDLGDDTNLRGLLPGEKPYPNGVQNVDGKLVLNGHELPNAKPDTEIKPGENGSVTYTDGTKDVTVWPNGVTHTKEGDKEEYRQGNNTIRFDGHKWYAQRQPDGGIIEVSAPYNANQNLSRGEIRTAAGDDAYILGGSLASGDNDGFYRG